MNGRRSISMRKGYLLTALAAAVLLAASSGTAYAQGTVRLDSTSGTVAEGASAARDTGDPLKITITVGGFTEELPRPVGDLTIVHNADTDANEDSSSDLTGAARRVWQLGTGTGFVDGKRGLDNNAMLTYSADEPVITLAIIDPTGDDDWDDDKFTLSIRSSMLGVSPSPGTFNGVVVDDEVAPTAKFKRASIKLTEQSTTMVDVAVEKSTRGTMPPIPPAISRATSALKFTASHPDAIVVGATCPVRGSDEFGVQVLRMATDGSTALGPVRNAMTGAMEFSLSNISALATDADTLTLEACSDMSGFRDPMITLTFLASSLKTDVGTLTAGSPLTITIESDDPVPTVSFATTSVLIDEGSTNTVAILATESTGPEVGSVNVEVSGDAMLSLWQDMDMIEANGDGSYTVDLGGSANTILTISADSDAALEDGMTSTGTITLMSASGADIGDRDAVTVTVNGSTAVPAIPLLGQLLLALFLLAGGARLYRRRQG